MSFAENKLIIVSNRLPVNVRKKNGKLQFQESSGGLATGLTSVNQDHNGVWIGWPGISSDELTLDDKHKIEQELKKHNCLPVFLNQEQIDSYYLGYSNETLWPLLHYTHERSEHSELHWECYQEVNSLFTNQILKIADKDSLIWVHDYHLMLAPALVRAKLPKARIGFFLHTPFPSFEIFRLLPERKQILEGLLGADLIGFHTYDYARHYMNSILRVVGYENDSNEIAVGERRVQVDVFPIGIDYQKYAQGITQAAVKERISQMKLLDSKVKVLLSFDRADYSKGVPEKLSAYEYFLSNHPEYHGKVSLLMIAAPSRVDIRAYQKLQQEIEQRVSQINGAYSTVDWAPISYIYRDLDFDEVIATYCLSDVMLVTPLRDGMNLMAKEFIATKQKGSGVLILSEMAGAASELLEAIVVNPNDQKMVSEAIVEALNMPVREQKKRLKNMQKRISEYSIHKWANDFVKNLTTITTRPQTGAPRITPAIKSDILDKYRSAKKRLILLDYDGTLKSFVPTPDIAAASPPRKLVNMLKRLGSSSKNKVVIISGRPRLALTRWFKSVPIELVAEHGAWVRQLHEWVRTKGPQTKWKDAVEPVLRSFNERTPGSLIEQKDFAFVWHYRNVSPGLAYIRNRELVKELEAALNGLGKNIGIFEGNKILEIKPRNLQKGEIVEKLVKKKEYDFVMAMGDDYTDEDMFRALPESAITIKVGSGTTNAQYQVDSVEKAHQLIDSLSRSA